MGATKGETGDGRAIDTHWSCGVVMAALAVAAPATAAGREATVDRQPRGPTAHSAALPLAVPVVGGLAVRLAAGPAARFGAGIVAGVIGRRAPQIGRIRTARSIKDARTVTRRKLRDGFHRTRRWLKKKWPDMKPYTRACLGGAAVAEEDTILRIAAGEALDLSWETELRRSAAGCGLLMAGTAAGRILVDRRLK
jgi:hypothetical protein